MDENDYNENTSITTISDSDTNIDFSDAFELIRINSELYSQEEKEPFIDTITDDDIIDITNTVYELADEYINVNIITFHDPSFHNKMEYEITEYVFENWFNAGLCEDIENEDDTGESDYNDVSKLITNIINDYFDISNQWSTSVPKRVVPHFKTHIDFDNIQNKIESIRAIPQPEQRTDEWYKFRHTLITASNLGKVFGSEPQRNSLIYEKCSPCKETDTNGYTYVNTQSPMHWGQNYEPFSVMLYERKFNSTKFFYFSFNWHIFH